MSNPVNWRGKGRTATPNSRQKRNRFYLDAHPVCQGCWAARSAHAHHLLDGSFSCRTSWHAMRGLCEPCHVRWHKPIAITFTVGGIVVGSARIGGHEQIQFPATIPPAG